MGDDLAKVLFTEEQIQSRLAELAVDIWKDYEGKDLLLVGVLKGARTSTPTSPARTSSSPRTSSTPA